MSERVFERANQRHGADAWLDDLTGTFLAAVDTVPDDGFTVPTALPDALGQGHQARRPDADADQP